MRKRPLPYDPEAARRHLLKSDPVMRDIVRRCGAYEMEARGQPYQSLLRAILYQQLAGPAALSRGGHLPAESVVHAQHR
jgi:3-methyladenine DNA glycosylase/8-oxoguanine DNA glycosylase